MATLASIWYRTQSGAAERCVVIVDGSPLSYRVMADEALAAHVAGDVLLDFHFEHRRDRTPFRAPISKLPPMVTHIRWPKVRVQAREAVDGAEPFLVTLEALAPPEDLTTL
jgi:hypothetical protein